MAARPRSRKRRDWPAGLRMPKPGYYGWEHPLTGAFMAIGRVSEAEAKIQALEANLHVQQLIAKPRLVDRLNGADETLLRDWLDTWLSTLQQRAEADPENGLAANTLKSYRTSCNALTEEIGDLAVRKCAVRDVASALGAIQEKRGKRTAQACRSVAQAAFTAAIAKGLTDTNPVTVTEKISVKVQRQRFTWETFLPVWQHIQSAGPAWLRNATALALVTGQRREDVAAAAFTAFTGDEWRFEQIKTGKRLAIPLDLRLDVFGLSLRDVLQSCRRTGVVSKFLVHQVRPYGNSPVGSPIFVDTLTKRFTEAVQAVHGDDPTLPTLHELRSLAKRLYLAQGGVDTKALLGHETEKMAAVYADARGAEYERVKLG